MHKTHHRAGRLGLAVAGVLLAALVGGCDSGDSGRDNSRRSDKDGKSSRKDRKPGRSDGDYLGALMRARRGAQMTACKVRLRSLYHAILSYRDMHDGQYPASLGELVKAGMATKDLLKCPAKRGQAYVYIPPPSPRAPGSTIIVRDAKPGHGDQVNVLRLDGRIESVPLDQVGR